MNILCHFASAVDFGLQAALKSLKEEFEEEVEEEVSVERVQRVQALSGKASKGEGSCLAPPTHA